MSIQNASSDFAEIFRIVKTGLLENSRSFQCFQYFEQIFGLSAVEFGSCGKSSSLVLVSTNLDNSSKRDVVED